jgi:ubiquinone/menaquinone biosynthesis C-methylase UbiE
MSKGQDSKRLQERYSNEAEAYKELWAPVVEGPSRSLLAELPLAEARRVLDVGTGVGMLLPDLQAAAPTALVIGVDHSEGMLGLASKDFSKSRMDASRLAFLPNKFDVAVMMFVLFHLPQPGVGLAEIRQVLAARGTIGTATWGHDPGFPAFEVWIEELDRHGAAVLDPTAELTQHELVNTREKMEELLVEAGYESIETWSGLCQHKSGVEEFISRRSLFGLGKRRLDSLGAQERMSCIEALRQRLTKLSPDDFIMCKEVIFAKAKVPA